MTLVRFRTPAFGYDQSVKTNYPKVGAIHQLL
jgi:hypothetical protein